MGDLVYELIDLVQRGGKIVGGIVVVLGLALVPAGYWLAFVMPGPGIYWPYMLVVSAFGLGMAGLGLSAFVGVNAKLANFDPEVDVPTRRGSARVQDLNVDAAAGGPTYYEAHKAASMPVPFWACGDCKIVGPGVTTADRCMRCGGVMNFVQVQRGSERGMAEAIVG